MRLKGGMVWLPKRLLVIEKADGGHGQVVAKWLAGHPGRTDAVGAQ